MTTTGVAKHWLNTARCGSAINGHSLESRLLLIDSNIRKLIANKTEFVELTARIRSVFEALDKTPKQIPDNEDDDLAELMKDLVDQVSSLCKFIENFIHLHFMFRLARNQPLLERIEQMHSALSRFIVGVMGILEPRQDARNNELIASLRALDQHNAWVVVIANEDIVRVTQELEKMTTGVEQEVVNDALCALRFEIPRLARLGTSNRLVEVVNDHLQHREGANANTVADEDDLPRHIPNDEITLGKQIGAGGCGEVFRAMLRSNIGVVVKRVITTSQVLRCQKDANVCDCDGHTKARKILLIRQEAQVRELRIWCQLNHPHILRLYGATSYGPNGSIVSEDACNGSLDVFLKKHQPRIWQLLYEAALGIHYMHWKGFVHGDIACDNIFIGGDWKAKIADFGLSFLDGAAFKSIPQSEKTGVFAPEFFDATPSQSLPADVFAFGMCIVEAYTGASPWKLVHPRAVRRLLMDGNLPDVFEKLPPSVHDLVKKMCAKNPAARPTIEQVVAELKVLVDDPPPPYVIIQEYEERD